MAKIHFVPLAVGMYCLSPERVKKKRCSRLLPVVLYVVLGIETGAFFDLAFKVAVAVIGIVYAWLLRSVLKGE